MDTRRLKTNRARMMQVVGAALRELVRLAFDWLLSLLVGGV